MITVRELAEGIRKAQDCLNEIECDGRSRDAWNILEEVLDIIDAPQESASGTVAALREMVGKDTFYWSSVCSLMIRAAEELERATKELEEAQLLVNEFRELHREAFKRAMAWQEQSEELRSEMEAAQRRIAVLETETENYRKHVKALEVQVNDTAECNAEAMRRMMSMHKRELESRHPAPSQPVEVDWERLAETIYKLAPESDREIGFKSLRHNWPGEASRYIKCAKAVIEAYLEASQKGAAK